MKENAQSIKLWESVADFYETYGTAFSHTRHSGWDFMHDIYALLKPGMTLLDVGAGNGRLTDELPEDVSYVAIEPSSTLRDAARHRFGTRNGREIRAGGFPMLPAQDGEADVTACIAVIHHIPTRVAQRAAISELARVTKRGGTVIVTAWDLRKLRRRQQRTLSVWLAAWLRFPMVKGGERGDVWFPWKADGARAKRYVHAFMLSELKRLFDEQAWRIERAVSEKNIVIIATRK